MLTISYFLRENKAELITAIFAALGYIASYTYFKDPGLSFFWSMIITLAAIIVIVYSKTRDKDFYFVSLFRRIQKEEWIGEGTFEYDKTHKAYAITNSFSGFIFSKCLTWSDYRFTFDFKILNTSVGVILRATNLSNLVMFQIFDHGIKTHIRVNSFWHVWEPAEKNLTFNEKLNMDEWYKCDLECNKGNIRIRVYNSKGKQVFDRDWNIPTGQVSFNFPKVKGLVIQAALSSIPFAINLEYGTVGFRNDSKERAVVRNFLIEKL